MFLISYISTCIAEFFICILFLNCVFILEIFFSILSDDRYNNFFCFFYKNYFLTYFSIAKTFIEPFDFTLLNGKPALLL